jgi:hypothetical protein
MVMIKILVPLLLLIVLNCTSHFSIDLTVVFCGRIECDDNGIDSAQIEVTDIKAFGHKSAGDFIGRIYYSDANGDFYLDMPGGVEWDENAFSNKKDYTKYISSATIKVSKESFKDTVVIFQNTDYESSNLNMDIVLKKQQ